MPDLLCRRFISRIRRTFLRQAAIYNTPCWPSIADEKHAALFMHALFLRANIALRIDHLNDTMPAEIPHRRIRMPSLIKQLDYKIFAGRHECLQSIDTATLSSRHIYIEQIILFLTMPARCAASFRVLLRASLVTSQRKHIATLNDALASSSSRDELSIFKATLFTFHAHLLHDDAHHYTRYSIIVYARVFTTHLPPAPLLRRHTAMPTLNSLNNATPTISARRQMPALAYTPLILSNTAASNLFFLPYAYRQTRS